jgi:hypothetical protein
MTFTRRSAAVGLAALPFLHLPAAAEPVVNVTLIDRMGSDSSEPPHLGMGMNGDMATAKMAVNANPKSVRRGPVTLKVTNQLVDENALHNFGSVKEIEPNKSAALTLDLKPGKYLLYCNLPGHYMAGMWTILEVTE